MCGAMSIEMFLLFIVYHWLALADQNPNMFVPHQRY